MTCRPEGPRRSKLIGAADQRKRSFFRQRDGRFLIRCDFRLFGVDLREGLPAKGGDCRKSASKKRNANGILHRRLQSKKAEQALLSISSRGNSITRNLLW